MDFSISKKLIPLIITIVILVISSIIIISINPNFDISNKIENSDLFYNSKISNYNKPTVWTTDINGHLIYDFKPGENVFIHGSNFLPNTYIKINLTRPDGEIEIAPYGRFTSDFLPLTDNNGVFNFYLYDLNGIEGEYLIQANDGINYANLIFYDSSIWTTDGFAQQKNFFMAGDPVGLDGEGLSSNSHLYYEVKDEPSRGNNVSWGWIDTDSNGEIIFTIIWDIPLSYSNIGQHKVYVYDTQTKSKTFSISSVDLIDNDNDGYYAPPNGEDCDDNDPNTYPGAPEICDGKDNDCDGVIPSDEIDHDGDGYSECEGDCDDSDSDIYPDSSEQCNGLDDNCDGVIPVNETDYDGDGYSECEGDCNDSDSETYPGAPEQCNGYDNDCDGTITDEEIDEDGDNYTPCQGDCDDTDPNTHPESPEQCDGKDNDCDGEIDEDCPVNIDNDNDGYYASPNGEDCDDNNPNTYPGAPEQCDGKDNDCDGVIPSDEIDHDGDGYSECEGDCDDSDSETYPGAPEQCNGYDNDCDGTITDEEIDEDGDNYTPCQGDCDDTDPNTYPGAPELYDGKDNDCDGEIEYNSAAELGNPQPNDGSKNNPLSFDWSIQINDAEIGIFDWNISCSNGQYSYSYEDQNGTKTLHLSGLSYSTTYTVWVKVYDYNSWNNKSYKFTTKGKSINSNIPPVAIIEGLLIGFPGEIIDFDGSSSYDLDGYISSFSWNLDDGTILTGKNISYSYSLSGIYNVTLTVFDNDGAKNSTTSNIVIIKGNTPPELNLSINITGNLSVELTIKVIDLDGDIVSCVIDWDDNSLPLIFDLISNQSFKEIHTYNSYNTYEIYVTANDGSTITSDSKVITLSKEKNGDDKNNTNGKGNNSSNIFQDIIKNNEPFDEPFLKNKLHDRSILGDNPDKNFAKLIATILSIILLFLINYLIEFFSDYFSERTIDFRKNWKSRFFIAKTPISAPGAFLSFKEVLAIIASTLILSFVLTWTWVPDLSMFLETFVVFILIVLIIIFIREALRGFLCSKFKFHSEFYIWPLGAVMMFVSTAIGNTFSLAANHHYKEKDIKKCGKVSFIVSFVIYILLAIAFIINLYYPSTILQMIIIVSILNLFIDMFPLNPMDGYEVRHWNLYVWLCFYIIIIVSYVTVYFNLYP